uniref:Nucleolar GTP-binding protein 1 n=1 Tax=Noccaea caerulescens TaxID=107243 RepID=A0A1J3GDQ3_NOCCA
MEIIMEKQSFKKMSVVPNKKDYFLEDILSLREHQRPAIVVPKFKKSYRLIYVQNVRSAVKSIRSKLSKVLQEFPFEYDGDLLHVDDLMLARDQLISSLLVINGIATDFVRLLKKDDCDSLDKCKRIKVDALGVFYTLAMRCVPSLAYLDKIREYMADLEDDDEIEIPAAATTLTKTTMQQRVLAEEDCTVPHRLDVHNAADFVDPVIRSCLEDLERKHGFLLQQVDCKTWPQVQGAPDSATSSMKALAI